MVEEKERFWKRKDARSGLIRKKRHAKLRFWAKLRTSSKLRIWVGHEAKNFNEM